MIMEKALLEVDVEIIEDEMGKCWDWFQNGSVERRIGRVARGSRHRGWVGGIHLPIGGYI